MESGNARTFSTASKGATVHLRAGSRHRGGSPVSSAYIWLSSDSKCTSSIESRFSRERDLVYPAFSVPRDSGHVSADKLQARTFPTCDCSGCTTLQIVELINHHNITSYQSRGEEVSGYVGTSSEVSSIRNSSIEGSAWGCAKADCLPRLRQDEYDYGLAEGKPLHSYQQGIPRKYS